MAKPTFERGRQITASALNAVVDMIVKRIRGGRGISVKRAGDGIIISSTAHQRGGIRLYVTDTKANLDEITPVMPAFGFVTDTERYYAYDSTEDWYSISHLEA